VDRAHRRREGHPTGKSTGEVGKGDTDYDSLYLSETNLCCDQVPDDCHCKNPITPDMGLQHMPTEMEHELYQDEACWADCLQAGGLSCPGLRKEIIKIARASERGRKPRRRQIQICDAFTPWRNEHGYL